MNQAIGLIEVQGYGTAVMIADIMLKVAAVELIGVQRAKGFGWMTIEVAGDVGAVKAAVDAGKAKATENNSMISALVIPRPAKALDKIVINNIDYPKKTDPVKEQPAEDLKSNESQAIQVEQIKQEEQVATEVESIKATLEKEQLAKAALEEQKPKEQKAEPAEKAVSEEQKESVPEKQVPEKKGSEKKAENKELENKKAADKKVAKKPRNTKKKQ